MSSLALPGAETAKETWTTFDLYPDHDPISPAGGKLLSELGMDDRTVRDSRADDLARRCPDCEVRTDES